jgi:hypothetical protein
MDKLKAAAPFVRYNSIENELYPQLQSKLGRGYTVIDAKFTLAKKANTAAKTNAPTITSFTPTTVNGGATYNPTTNVLTIAGTNFGAKASPAAVIFDDANDGSGGNTVEVSATDNLIVSWTPTEIKVRVPARAGTGTISVRDASNATATSFQELNINYGILTATFSGYTKQLNLMNDNGNGGYSIFYSTSTAGGGIDMSSTAGASTKACFQRALYTWKEDVGFNGQEDGNTTSQGVSLDGQCLVTYDNTNTGNAPLSSGVLAVCYSFFNYCTLASQNEFQKTEFDIVIRNTGVSVGSTSFEIGPCAPGSSSIDLETVILHELGHAINLAHINDGSEGLSTGNPPKLMNYAVAPRYKRTAPDYAAYSGALYCCTPKGATYGTCLAQGEMVQLPYTVVTNDDCPLSFPLSPLAPNTTVAFDLIHATSNKYVDPSYTSINTSSTGVGVTNNQYYAFKTDNAGSLTITVTNYSVYPTTASSCLSNNAIEFALYQVNSCPTGQNFPDPVAGTYKTFNGNTSWTISGLTANTSYLIFVDGVVSTKATFNMTFTGTALPIKLSSFTGEVKETYNNLNWVADEVQNVKSIVIERSFDGTDFTAVGTISSNNVNQRYGNFKDYKPARGNNYYRLAIHNNDGSVQYSNVVLLKRNEKLLFTVNPNPAKDFVEVQISAEVKGAYTLVLYNAAGQTVTTQKLEVNTGRNTTRLNLNGLAKGIYRVALFNVNQSNIKSIPVAVY